MPFPPGGPLDLIGRAIADRMQADLKQPFIIENKAGAGGNLGSDAVAKSDPDGYTLLLGLSSTTTANPRIYGNFPFDPAKDLAPISIVATYSQSLVVHPSLPVKTVKEFVDYARNNAVTLCQRRHWQPRPSLDGVVQLKANFPAISVPYRGNAPLVVDLLSGEVKSGFVAAGGIIQNIRDGKLRGLAISTKERSPQLSRMFPPSLRRAIRRCCSAGTWFCTRPPARRRDCRIAAEGSAVGAGGQDHSGESAQDRGRSGADDQRRSRQVAPGGTRADEAAGPVDQDADRLNQPSHERSTWRPNFLLIITDQHRADHLGCYGNPIVRTPAIDAHRGERRGVRPLLCHVRDLHAEPRRR